MTPPRDPPPRSIAVLAHGAGSTGEVVGALLPADVLGVDEVVVREDRTGDVDRVGADLATAVRAHRRAGRTVRFVGGISLGAHAAVRWAAEGSRDADEIEGLLLVMPAWTGAPGPVAALTAASADDVAAHGRDAVLARLAADPLTRDDWVVAALRRGWSQYDDVTLVAALRTAASSRGPTSDELEAVAVPCGIAALADDVLHPAEVARTWTSMLPAATMTTVPRHAPGVQGAALARAVVQAWQASAAWG